MSNPARGQRLFRAVRLLPEAVRVGNASREGDVPEETPEPLREESAEERQLRESRLEILAMGERVASLEQELARERARSEALESEQELLRRRYEGEAEALKRSIEERLESDREAAKKMGHDEGFHAGHAQGEHRAKEDLEALYRDQFATLVNQLETVHGALLESLETLVEANQSRLVRLWERVLVKLLQREVKLNEATVLTLLRQVLLRTSDRERLVVYLHPDDVGAFRERQQQEEFGDILRGVKHIEFIADEHVDQGSCLVETNLGIYDARWRTQLEQVHREIDALLLEGEAQDDETKG